MCDLDPKHEFLLKTKKITGHNMCIPYSTGSTGDAREGTIVGSRRNIHGFKYQGVNVNALKHFYNTNWGLKENDLYSAIPNTSEYPSLITKLIYKRNILASLLNIFSPIIYICNKYFSILSIFKTNIRILEITCYRSLILSKKYLLEISLFLDIIE